MRRLPFAATMAALLLALAGVLAVSPFVGPTPLSWAAVMDDSIPRDENPAWIILWNIRLPRVLFGALVGMTLSVAGAVFQALFRNDLAEPYTLGVSSGATFGATLGMKFLGSVAFVATAGALLGGAAAVAVILAVARRTTSADRTSTLLLGGVTLSILFGAGILIIQYLANPFEAYGMIRWMMGGLDVARMAVPGMLALPLSACILVAMSRARALNAMTLGDRTAADLGFDPNRDRAIAIGAVSLATALAVAFCGPIGFVGLIVPHALRRLLGPDHRRLLPATAIAGAAFLVLCDTVARRIGGATELPVGIVTACLGGPFFLWILLQTRRA